MDEEAIFQRFLEGLRSGEGDVDVEVMPYGPTTAAARGVYVAYFYRIAEDPATGRNDRQLRQWWFALQITSQRARQLIDAGAHWVGIDDLAPH